MPVISFASSKGGAGKTTACVVLGTEIAQSTTVTIIDADPAGRIKRWASKTPLPTNIIIENCTNEDAIFASISKARLRSKLVLIDLEGTANVLNSRAIGKSDLVIIPMGDEQMDADDAVRTLRRVLLESEGANRKISARVLFTRVQAAVKSATEKRINAEMRANAPCFETELHKRTGFSALHSYGGTLSDLQPQGVNGIEKCVENAQSLAAEVLKILVNQEASQ